MGPFACMGPFRFRVALLHLIGPAIIIWGPFTPVWTPRRSGGSGVVYAGSTAGTLIGSSGVELFAQCLERGEPLGLEISKH